MYRKCRCRGSEYGQQEKGFHSGGVTGRDRDHRHAGNVAVAGGPSCTRGYSTDAMWQQSEAGSWRGRQWRVPFSYDDTDTWDWVMYYPGRYLEANWDIYERSHINIGRLLTVPLRRFALARGP